MEVRHGGVARDADSLFRMARPRSDDDDALGMAGVDFGDDHFCLSRFFLRLFAEPASFDDHDENGDDSCYISHGTVISTLLKFSHNYFIGGVLLWQSKGRSS